MTANFTDLHSSHQDCPVTIGFDPSNSTVFPESAIPTWIALSTISGIVAIPTFWINLLVIWTILESENLRCVNYNILLAILSMNDLWVGIVINPLFIALNICFTLGCASVCKLLQSFLALGFLSAGWSLSTLMLLSVERYLSIEHPLYYNTKISTRKLLTALAVTWLLVVIILILRFKFDDSYLIKQIPIILYIGIGAIVIIYCLMKVNKTAHRQMKVINAQKVAVQGPNIIKDSIKEYKRTFALVTIAFATVLFHVPILITRLMSLTNLEEWSIRYVIPSITITLVALQSFINPLILSIRLSYIRAGVVKKLSRCYACIR